MIPYQNEEEIIRNLVDAGCDEETIEQFKRYYADDKNQEELKLLCKHRCDLMDHLHQEQRKIDCLDYLIYQMKQAKGKGKEGDGKKQA